MKIKQSLVLVIGFVVHVCGFGLTRRKLADFGADARHHLQALISRESRLICLVQAMCSIFACLDSRS